MLRFRSGWRILLGAIVFTGVLAPQIAVAQQSTAASPRLQWKFQAGDEQHYRLTHRLDAMQDLGRGGEAKYQVAVTIDATWHVDDVQENGAALVRQQVRRVRLDVHGPGQQSVEYDSAGEEAARGFAARVAPVMKAWIESPLQATISPRGEITEVVVPEELEERLRAAPGAKKMGDLSTGEAIKNLLRQNVVVLPQGDSPAQDQQWTDVVELQHAMFGKMTAEKKYRYVETREIEGRELAVIELAVALDIVKQPAPDRSEVDNPPRVELAGQESSGEILFDRQAGRLESSHFEQSLDVNITVAEQTARQRIIQVVDFQWLADLDEVDDP